MDFPIVLDRDLFPVQAFFNAVSDRNFISTLEGFSNSIGAGFNDAVCEFPNENTSPEEAFSGVRFYIFDEELVISHAHFLLVLQQVCSLYLTRHPEERERVHDLLSRIEDERY